MRCEQWGVTGAPAGSRSTRLTDGSTLAGTEPGGRNLGCIERVSRPVQSRRDFVWLARYFSAEHAKAHLANQALHSSLFTLHSSLFTLHEPRLVSLIRFSWATRRWKSAMSWVRRRSMVSERV